MTIQNKNIINISDEYRVGADDMNTSEKSATGVNLVEFKPTNFTDRLIVSYDGRVYDVHTKKYRKVSLISEQFKHRYPRVNLTVDRKVKSFLVHRLVADAWIDNPDQLPVVNHKEHETLWQGEQLKLRMDFIKFMKNKLKV